MKVAVRYATVTGAPIHAGGATIVTESRLMTVELPGAVVVWHTPSAIRMKRGAATTRTRVVDVTRVLQVLLAVSGIAVGLALWKRR